MIIPVVVLLIVLALIIHSWIPLAIGLVLCFLVVAAQDTRR
jgi:hypothetical protein